MFCFHDRIKQHTFANGQTIKMCPDCTTFDNKRIEILKQGEAIVANPNVAQHWGLILDDALIPYTGTWQDLHLSAGSKDIEHTCGITVDNVDDVLPHHPFKGCMDWDGIVLAWADVPRLQPHRHPTRQRLDAVYDHDWATRQKAFEHTLSMPRLRKNFCPLCREYVNQDHEHLT